MQRVDGEPAQTLCASEFEHLMEQLQAEVEDARAADPEAFPLGYAIYSLDNAKPHRRFQRNTPADRLNVIPAYSPDIHKVVEHPLNPFNDRWYTAFTLDRKCTTATAAMALAADVLHQTKPESIKKDLDTLPATLRSIIANKGDWADDDLC